MSIARTIFRNLVSSWAGFAVQILITLALTPIVIHSLGLEAYGVWLFLQSIVGYYGLIDLGLRAGLTQSITHSIAERDYFKLRRNLGTAVPVLLVIGTIVLVVCVGLSLLLPKILQISAQIRSSLTLVVLLQGLSVVMQLVTAPYTAIAVGANRYDAINAVTIVARLLSAISIYTIMILDCGLVGISIVTLLSAVFEWFLRYRMAMQLVPEVKGVTFTFDPTALKELRTFGIWNLMIECSRQLIYFSDVLVVGILFSATAIAPFGVVSTVVEYGTRLIIISSSVLFPTMAKLTAEKDLDGLRVLYFNANRITLSTSLAMLILGTFWISPFLAVWLGDGPDQEIIVNQATGLFFGLSLAYTFVGLQRTGIQLMLAQKMLDHLAMLFAVEAVANLLLSVLLASYFGLQGIVLGTLIPAALMCFVFHLPKHASILKVTYRELLFQTLLRPIVFASLVLIATVALFNFTPIRPSWTILIWVGSASLAILLACSWMLLSKNQICRLAYRLRLANKYAD